MTRSFRYTLDTGWAYPLYADNVSCPECQRPADPFGDYQVGYSGNGDMIHGHNSLRDVLFTAARSAALAPQKEASALI